MPFTLAKVVPWAGRIMNISQCFLCPQPIFRKKYWGVEMVRQVLTALSLPEAEELFLLILCIHILPGKSANGLMRPMK